MRYLVSGILALAILCMLAAAVVGHFGRSHGGPDIRVLWNVPSGEYGGEVVCTSSDEVAVLCRRGSSSVLHSVSLSKAFDYEMVLARDGICLVAGSSGPAVAVNCSSRRGFEALYVDTRRKNTQVLGTGMLFNASVIGNAFPLCPYGQYALVVSGKKGHRQLKVLDCPSGVSGRDVPIVQNYSGEYLRWHPGSCRLVWFDPRTLVVREEKDGHRARQPHLLRAAADTEVVLSPDATRAAVFSSSLRSSVDVLIVDVATGKSLSTLRAQSGTCRVQCVRWSPDSSAVAVGLSDRNYEGLPFIYVFFIKGRNMKVTFGDWRFFGDNGTIDWFADNRKLVAGAYRGDGSKMALLLVDTRRNPP